MFINFHFWAHITSLTPPLFIEVCFPSQYICVWGINFTADSTIFSIRFRNCSDSMVFFILYFIKLSASVLFKEIIHVLNITKMSPHEVSS